MISEDIVRGIEGYEQEALKYKQMPIRVQHHFAGGIYERECFVPAGLVITGKVHKTAHLAKLTSGRMRLLTGRGGEIVEGPKTFKGFPGDKKMAFTETDCVFSTFHVVGEERCLETLEKMLVTDSLDKYFLEENSVAFRALL